MQKYSKLKTLVVASALTLAAGAVTAVQAETIAPANKTVQVKFARGATNGVYKGALRGTQVHAYRFYAKKGQVLNVDLGNSASGMDVAVNYLGKQETDVLDSGDQVLPYTGSYEVRVLQTRESARSQGRALRPYEVAISITGGGASAKDSDANVATGGNASITDAPWLLYRCDGGKQVRARYHYGEATANAEIEANGRTLGMQYSADSNSEQQVFKGDGYTWSVSNAGAKKAGARDGFLYKNTTTVVNGKRMAADEIMAKNCNLAR